ncbi:hypothetical protein K7X08_014957 [Anisodus acutangulus]|uniref:Uncharacterized protein n=1 Tax=Anisodus acutangulus TaxID=402998 RepID=A0A9Q1LJE6_9SOLA|nr:hypothetical protein K7X08_014957 [Anisodus acutangulus]
MPENARSTLRPVNPGSARPFRARLLMSFSPSTSLRHGSAKEEVKDSTPTPCSTRLSFKKIIFCRAYEDPWSLNSFGNKVQIGRAAFLLSSDRGSDRPPQ